MGVTENWRQNISIGLYLGAQPYGALMDDVLVNALGFDPNGQYPQNNRERYIARLRNAQQLGEEKYAARIPGYFTIRAQPFGNTWVYRALWYVWTNPSSSVNQAVLVADTDFRSMRRNRDKDLATRKRTVRGVRTADNVYQQRRAIANGNANDVYAIQAQMVTDGTLGELLTNQLGLLYAEMAPVLDQIAQGNPFGSIQFNFTQTAKKMRKLEAELQKQQSKVLQQLSTWIIIQTGLPGNVRQLALQDAQNRLAGLGGSATNIP